MIDIILIIGAVAFALLAAFIIGGVALYDIQTIHTRFLFNKHPYSRRYRARPIVTALVIAGPHIDMTHRCLDSLKQSSHRRLEVIIISTSPSTTLKRLAASYGTRTRSVRLFTSQRPENSAIDAAYRRYGHGEIVIILRDTDRLDPTAISKSIWHFNARDAISSLQVHKVVPVGYSSSGLLQIYTGSLQRLSRKLMSTFPRSHGNTTPTFYRKDAFLQRRSPSIAHTYFADDVVSYSQPQKHYLRLGIHGYMRKIKQLQRSLHLPVHPTRGEFFAWCIRFLLTLGAGTFFVCLPILLGYFVFLALVPHQPLFIFLCMATAGLFLVFGIWTNQHYTLQKKLLYSLLIPANFIPLLADILIQLSGFIIAGIVLVRQSLHRLLSGKKYSQPRNVYEYD